MVILCKKFPAHQVLMILTSETSRNLGFGQSRFLVSSPNMINTIKQQSDDLDKTASVTFILNLTPKISNYFKIIFSKQ